jgi:hypothetical protein
MGEKAMARGASVRELVESVGLPDDYVGDPPSMPYEGCEAVWVGRPTPMEPGNAFSKPPVNRDAHTYSWEDMERDSARPIPRLERFTIWESGSFRKVLLLGRRALPELIQVYRQESPMTDRGRCLRSTCLQIMEFVGDASCATAVAEDLVEKAKIVIPAAVRNDLRLYPSPLNLPLLLLAGRLFSANTVPHLLSVLRTFASSPPWLTSDEEFHGVRAALAFHTNWFLMGPSEQHDPVCQMLPSGTSDASEISRLWADWAQQWENESWLVTALAGIETLGYPVISADRRHVQTGDLIRAARERPLDWTEPNAWRCLALLLGRPEALDVYARPWDLRLSAFKRHRLVARLHARREVARARLAREAPPFLSLSAAARSDRFP